jgi:phosphotransferase system HPr (HPr) family protein
MLEILIKITNAAGLHARPATFVVNGAKKFQSSITAKKGEKEVNLKSLISLLSLGICQNEEVLIKANGIDEKEAIEEIVSIINNLKD